MTEQLTLARTKDLVVKVGDIAGRQGSTAKPVG